MFIELWNHGSVDDNEKPCGEVAVFSVSGEKIHYDILSKLICESELWRFKWFGHLPTGRVLMAECSVEEDDGGVALRVAWYKCV